MRTSAIACTLCIAVAAAGWAAEEPEKTLSVGAGGRLFAERDVEALLARPYEEFVPMACTGECLWAAHPGGWAFNGATHYYLIAPHSVGFDLELFDGETPLTPAKQTAYPSHVAFEGGTTAVSARGAKWITADDVLAVALTLANQGYDTRTVRAVLSLPSAAPAVGDGVFSWKKRHAGLNLLLTGLAPEFTHVDDSGKPARVYWVQGEAPVDQRGSRGTDKKEAASGGEVLGSGFGGDPGDFATWRIAVPRAVPDAVLSIRYARHGSSYEKDAVFEVTCAGTTQRLTFAGTGGWGGSPNDLKLAEIPLGALDAGTQEVTVRALEDQSNTNIDALGIHAAGLVFEPGAGAKTALERRIELAPGASAEVRVFLAVDSKPDDARAALKRVATVADPLADQRATYTQWLVHNVPGFRCADPYIDKMYWHRATSVTKKTLFRVGEGRLPRWAIAEGRWTSSWFPNMISYGAGHQIRELRWLRDPAYVNDIITTWCENIRDDGIFPAYIRPHEDLPNRQYTDWITAAVYDACCVHPDGELLAQWAPALQKNIDGWLAEYDKDDDGLLLVDSHWWTGMEWQPSFFYFNDWDKDRQEQHLERVDLTAYVYGGAQNLSRILNLLGDKKGAEKYRNIALKMENAVLDHMWDPETEYIYSVEPETHKRAMVKEVIGCYPLYFGMFGGCGDWKYDVWKSITNPQALWTPWPVASASQQCPAYSQDIYFHGKEVGGCMWNGPTWPHANSLVLTAMANTLRYLHGYHQPEAPDETIHLTRDDFFELFYSYTRAQYRNQDLAYPWTGEYYNGETGAWRTEQRCYNHSTYHDIVIEAWAGVRAVESEGFLFMPNIQNDTPSFYIDGIRLRDWDVTVAWDAPEEEAGWTSPDKLKGLRVYVDGELRWRSPHSENVPWGLWFGPDGVTALT